MSKGISEKSISDRAADKLAADIRVDEKTGKVSFH